jgi:hypothetical protein
MKNQQTSEHENEMRYLNNEPHILHKQTVQKAIERERLIFKYWLMDKYIVKSGDHYLIKASDLEELENGIKINEDWRFYTRYGELNKDITLENKIGSK